MLTSFLLIIWWLWVPLMDHLWAVGPGQTVSLPQLHFIICQMGPTVSGTHFI